MIPHLAPAREKVDQATGMEPDAVYPSTTCLDDAELLRQLFEWFGSMPFAGISMGLQGRDTPCPNKVNEGQ